MSQHGTDVLSSHFWLEGSIVFDHRNDLPHQVGHFCALDLGWQ